MAKILIVDDEAHMRKFLEICLSRGGYAFCHAANGLEACQLAEKEQPSIIIMDVTMPVMDGLAALNKLKSNPTTAAIPVIMLTARGHNLPREEAQTSGASLFLTKPFSPSELMASAKRLIKENNSLAQSPD